MPVAVSSIGDVISLCLLLKDLVIALSDCRGASHEFQELIRELQILERVLLQAYVLLNSIRITLRFMLSVRRFGRLVRLVASPLMKN